MGLRRFLRSQGIGTAVPAAWRDEHEVIDRFWEYSEDQCYDREMARRRWESGYYAQPIPWDERVAWIKRHKRHLHYGTICKAREIYGEDV